MVIQEQLVMVIVVIGYGYCASCLEIQLNLVEKSFFFYRKLFNLVGNVLFFIGTGRFLI